MHPDVSKLIEAYGRWHHKVDYKPYANNALKRIVDIDGMEKVDNFGMELIRVNNK